MIRLFLPVQCMDHSSDVGTSAELVRTKSALTAAQTSMWLPQIMFPGRPVANIGNTVLIEGALDLQLFREAIRHLVAETDALRLSFATEGEAVYQEVRDRVDYTVERIDVSSARDPDAAAQQWIEGQHWTGIDWTGCPLFQFALIELSADRHIWFIGCNHLIIDTIPRLIERTAQIYSGLRDGVPLAPSGASSF